MTKKQFNIFLLILVVCHLYYWLFVNPNPDEAYYWMWGRYPDFSYHDHPALPPLIQGLFFQLFGKSLFVLRLPVFLSTILSLIIYSKFLDKLSFTQNKKAILLTIFSLPLIFLFTTFAWHDHLMMAMLLSSAYFWINFFTEILQAKKGKSADLFLASLFLGLAALCKYNAVFLALAVATTILFHKKLLVLLKDVRLYAAVVFCALIISPIILWNAQHQYGSFEFTLAQRTIQPLKEGRFFKGNIFGFLLGTLALLTPFVLYFSCKFSLKKQTVNSAYEEAYTALAKHLFWWSSGVFLFLSLFSNVLYYWNIPAYLLVLPLAIQQLIIRAPKLAKATNIFSAVAIILIVVHFGVLPLTAIVGGKDADGAYHFGWKNVKNTITNSSEYRMNTTLFGSSYRVASLLGYALNRKDVMSHSERFDQFDYWAKDKKYIQKETLILADDYSAPEEELKNLFQSFKILDTIPVRQFGFHLKEYYLYKGILKDSLIFSSQENGMNK